jgi:hypothetical protein
MLFASLLACSETCPPPDVKLDGVVWDVFVTPVEYTVDNEEAFPADSTPANGEHQLEIGWLTDELFRGAVTVTIDGQPFDGTGTWSEIECGHFSLSFSGIYEVDTGAQHGFASTATLTTYRDVLEGFLDWSETWKSEDGQVGTFNTAAQVEGAKASG